MMHMCIGGLIPDQQAWSEFCFGFRLQMNPGSSVVMSLTLGSDTQIGPYITQGQVLHLPWNPSESKHLRTLGAGTERRLLEQQCWTTSVALLFNCGGTEPLILNTKRSTRKKKRVQGSQQQHSAFRRYGNLFTSIYSSIKSNLLNLWYPCAVFQTQGVGRDLLPSLLSLGRWMVWWRVWGWEWGMEGQEEDVRCVRRGFICVIFCDIQEWSVALGPVLSNTANIRGLMSIWCSWTIYKWAHSVCFLL